MVTTIQKWGNSLGLRIPRALAAEARIEPGTPVNVRYEDGVLLVEPVMRRIYDLETMLEGVTEENRHEEVSTGAPVGGEVW